MELLLLIMTAAFLPAGYWLMKRLDHFLEARMMLIAWIGANDQDVFREGGENFGQHEMSIAKK